MNSHDVGRGRGSISEALRSIKSKSLVAGIASDRLFPIEDQALIAKEIGGQLIGGELQVIESEFGHDGFLIENDSVSKLLRLLFES
jgi:homoserine O-acetyltransferase